MTELDPLTQEGLALLRPGGLLEAFVSWVQLETWPRDMLVKIVAEELLGRFPDPVSLEAYRTEAGRAVDLRLREVTEKDA